MHVPFGYGRVDKGGRVFFGVFFKFGDFGGERWAFGFVWAVETKFSTLQGAGQRNGPLLLHSVRKVQGSLPFKVFFVQDFLVYFPN